MERSKTMNPDKRAKTHSFTPNPGTILSGLHMHALTFKQRSTGAAVNARHMRQVVALLPCSMHAHETTDQNLRWRRPLPPF